ncbi:hypothetical protein C8R44DRAFT_890692 [Mycena epipterygia]|nr:hypothetical protein C8R44DRAFT_890692 [Mycena epipterygia]
MTPADGTLDRPNHILDRILRWSPTFKTLHAAIRVSKAWHQVFQSYPNSIVRAVAENVVGPAFSEALRVLRYAEDINGQEKANTDSEITPEEHDLLRKNSLVVKGLESVFSSRHRNRLSRTSQLTWLESWRFSRAMYRVLLYCQVFRMPAIDDQVRDMEALERDDIEAKRLTMLSAYSTAELLELNAAVVFLRAIAQDLGEDYDGFDEDELASDLGDLIISPGPAVVLKAHQYNHFGVLVDKFGYTFLVDGPYTLLSGFFAIPLQRIWEAHEVPAPDSEAAHNSILDPATFCSPPCDICACVSDSQLWHEGNWTDLHLDIRDLVKGNLAENFTEMEVLDEVKPNPERNIPKLIAEVHTLRTGDFKDWNKSDALCETCLEKVLAEHLHLWLLALKLKDRGEKNKDCWYGYDCTIQTRVTLHALTYNHLCSPMRPCPQDE